jgi:hypothetical protein
MPFVQRYPPASTVGTPNAKTSLKPRQNVAISETVTLGPGVVDVVLPVLKLKLAMVRLVGGWALTMAEVTIP